MAPCVQCIVVWSVLCLLVIVCFPDRLSIQIHKKKYIYIQHLIWNWSLQQVHFRLAWIAHWDITCSRWQSFFNMAAIKTNTWSEIKRHVPRLNLITIQNFFTNLNRKITFDKAKNSNKSLYVDYISISKWNIQSQLTCS